MKTIMSFIVALLCFAADAQEENPVQVNKPFPSFITLNYHGKATPISSFRGRNIILDLFSSTCVVCFQMLPKTDSLQRKFGNKLNFLLIGYEDGTIKKTYKRFESKFKLKLDVTFDSSFSRQISFGFNPLYVWISKDGIVKLISGPDQVNESTIEKFLTDGILEQRSFVTKPFIDETRLHFPDPDSMQNNFRIRTILTDEDTSVRMYIPPTLLLSPARPFFQAINVTMRHLYSYALLGRSYWLPSDSLYQIAWPYPILDDKISVANRELIAGKVFCFSFNTNALNPDTAILRESMLLALESYFNIKASLELRLMPYYSLQLLDGMKEKLLSKFNFIAGNDSHAQFDMKHVTINQLAASVARRVKCPQPFINETGINEPIDIKIDGPFTDIRFVKEGFLKAGIRIVEKFKPMWVMALTSLK